MGQRHGLQRQFLRSFFQKKGPHVVTASIRCIEAHYLMRNTQIGASAVAYRAASERPPLPPPQQLRLRLCQLRLG